MSGGADQSIGMMDSAYFVGRKEILDWVNSTCQTNLSNVEQTCNGAVACQILDAIYPNSVPMNKVDWSANKDYEFIHNYKLLQKAFTSLRIDKHIEVDRLIRGKYQDNLEFMQWFKKFYELNKSVGVEYDAINQRSKGKGGDAYTSKHNASSAPMAATGAKKRVPMTQRTSSQSEAKRNTVTSESAKVADTRATKSSMSSQRTVSSAPVASVDLAALAALKKENTTLTDSIAQLQLTVEGLVKERDFYFEKLRDIELALQDAKSEEGSELVQTLFKILYATNEDFLVPEPVDQPLSTMSIQDDPATSGDADTY